MSEPAYTRKEAYVLKLHELLWQFIHQHDPQMTGVVHEVAEQVLADLQASEPDDSMDGDHASALAAAAAALLEKLIFTGDRKTIAAIQYVTSRIIKQG